MKVTHVPAHATHDLRRRVLRDGRADAEVVFPGDDAPTTVHFGAFPSETPPPCSGGDGGDARRAPLAIASLYLSPLKDQSLSNGVPSDQQYQFRGMASAPDVRGLGYADAIMRAMIAHLRSQAPSGTGRLLWCNARLGAIGFYERFGMRTVSPEFLITGVGPHVVMTLVVE